MVFGSYKENMNLILKSTHLQLHLTSTYVHFYRVRQKYLTIFKTVVSGTVSVGNLSLSALLAKLKAFQLPWSAGL
jgi:hypothetical protein